MKGAAFILIGFSLLMISCGVILPSLMESETPFDLSVDEKISNGASIYYTGRTSDGNRIQYSGGPIGGMMMSQRLSCAACHGDDGSGGVHLMHMQIMDAPDIRFSALSGDNHENGTDDLDHTTNHEGYDLDAFERAVVEGQHPDGASLSAAMPRWKLRDRNLEVVSEIVCK